MSPVCLFSITSYIQLISIISLKNLAINAFKWFQTVTHWKHYFLSRKKKKSLNGLYNMQHWMSWLMKPQGIWNRACITGAILRPRSLLFCKNYYGNRSIHCNMFIRSISILSSLEYSNLPVNSGMWDCYRRETVFLKDGRCSFVYLRSQSEHIRVILLSRKEGAWSTRKKVNVGFRFVNTAP